jgi:UDP-glucose 4-epimerase
VKILITGAAGFIGSNLAKELYQRNHQLVLVDNLEYGYLENLDKSDLQSKLIVADIRSPIKESIIKGVDIVFHFAGISSLPECQANPIKAVDVNVNGTVNLLEAARKNNVKKFIFASTSAVYENNHKAPFSEEQEINPDLIYSLTKKMSEDIVKSYKMNYKMNVIICRFFNVYGANQDFRRKNPPFTSYIAKEALNSGVLKLFNFQDVKRDYIYISDLIEILEDLMFKGEDSENIIYNLCSGLSYSPFEIISILSRIINKDIKITEGKPEEFWIKYPELFGTNGFSNSRIEKEILKISIGSNEKIRNLTGKASFIEMKQGLEEIVKYQKHSGI